MIFHHVLWINTRDLILILECQAAYELFTKDVSDQMLGINELDLVLRSLGHVSTDLVYMLIHVCTHNCTCSLVMIVSHVIVIKLWIACTVISQLHNYNKVTCFIDSVQSHDLAMWLTIWSIIYAALNMV